MFSKHYQGYALVGLILIGWSALIEARNVGNPRVQHVTLHNQGLHTVVKCDVWNPRYEEVYVKALIRLINPGNVSSGRPVTASPCNVVKSRIAPRSYLPIDELVMSIGDWPDAEVRVFVITDPEEIKQIAKATPLTKPAVQ